ncbi:uncharacterized protein RAG0_13988 [Rhynchosporium agropyri]|uniref:Uncharacterized protein n=1 Tax=Rhynchosporium agropyri TaxID=914238 RepID=A0A1E1LF18_9HELO|nr:uncharacterized protein RAG0_13988 [Rhynchosporium agropyri]
MSDKEIGGYDGYILKYNRADHRRTGPEPIKCRRTPPTKHMNQCHSNSDSIPRLGGHHHHHHHHRQP